MTMMTMMTLMLMMQQSLSKVINHHIEQELVARSGTKPFHFVKLDGAAVKQKQQTTTTKMIKRVLNHGKVSSGN